MVVLLRVAPCVVACRYADSTAFLQPAGWLGGTAVPFLPRLHGLPDFGNDADSDGIVDLLMNCEDLKGTLSLAIGSAGYPPAEGSAQGDSPHVDLPLCFPAAPAHPSAPLASTPQQQVLPWALDAAANHCTASGLGGQQQSTGVPRSCSGALFPSADAFTVRSDARQLQRASTTPLLDTAASASAILLQPLCLHQGCSWTVGTASGPVSPCASQSCCHRLQCKLWHQACPATPSHHQQLW